MDAPAISARGLTKRYGDFTAVKGIDFDVPRGVVYGFLGPNGAGKTSTMRMLYGLSPLSAGSLQVLGMDVTREGRAIKQRMGVVPQISNLDEDMTARENLVSYGRFFDLGGPTLRKRVDELLAYVQLSEKADERCTELSGGMKRRLLIARALLNDPELLLLDEPTTGLDPQSRSLLWGRIKELRRAGKTVLLTTHYMEEAEKLCDELLIIDEGRIIEQGRPQDLVAKHVGREVLEATLPEGEDARVLKALAPLLAASERHGDELRLFGARGDALLDELHRVGVRPTRHLVRRATLEDVFLKLTGRRLNE